MLIEFSSYQRCNIVWCWYHFIGFFLRILKEEKFKEQYSKYFSIQTETYWTKKKEIFQTRFETIINVIMFLKFLLQHIAFFTNSIETCNPLWNFLKLLLRQVSGRIVELIWYELKIVLHSIHNTFWKWKLDEKMCLHLS